MNLTVNKAQNKKQKPQDETKLGFGKIFTDHMLTITYSRENGWHNAQIRPFENLSLSPACMVLHYGQTIFEGMKAYGTEQNGVNLFRPWDNFARLNASARRMCIPEIDEDFALKALCELLKIEKDWIPKSEGTSLYIRPSIIATDPFLGVRAGNEYLFFIILTPVGAYYSSGLKPVDIYVEDEYVRAVVGGTGAVKTGGNYAASLAASDLASKKGYSQVLWLDGIEKKYVEEVGSMNIFFKIKGELYTSPLTGSVLPGITRDSVIRLAKETFGVNVHEERLSISDIFEESKSGALEEVFGTGTAAVISPVGSLKWEDNHITVADGGMGELTLRLYNKLTGIQYGREKDEFGWTMTI
ncbi:MAG: branched-chain amino acid aminotransferase [Christensenellales bacterium]